MASTPEHDSACEVAHGNATQDVRPRTLVAVFASPVAEHLLRYAADVGYETVLVEPDDDRVAANGHAGNGTVVRGDLPELDGETDLVVTDHHRPELGEVLRDALARPARWIGVMGNPRHPGPHVSALAALGVPHEEVARVHRPVGLNIGSRTPPEIAIATLAGLLADRNGRPGGFEF
jgi:xanthine dehydrogenase accessory factor